MRGSDYIGMDSEWRPIICKFEYAEEHPAIFQIANRNKAFLIDMIALADSAKLDAVLTEIVSDPKTVCLGFSFVNDIKLFKW